jgi:hypothetical protein
LPLIEPVLRGPTQLKTEAEDAHPTFSFEHVRPRFKNGLGVVVTTVAELVGAETATLEENTDPKSSPPK